MTVDSAIHLAHMGRKDVVLKLREYQEEAVRAVWEKIVRSNNALLVLSCGLGKTECVFGLMKKAIMAKPDIRIVFAVNRRELLKQTLERASKVFPQHMLGTFTGGSKKHKQIDRAITIGTIQSLVKANFSKTHLLVFDEAHRVNLDEGSHYHQFLKQESEKNPKLKIVGLTATPFRATGFIYGEKNSLFDSIVYEKGLKWAIANGFLVPPRMKRVEEQFDTSDLSIVAGDYDQGQLEELSSDLEKIKAQVDDALPRLEDRKKIVWACTGIKHSELLASILRDRGESAIAYHSKTADRDTVMKEWKANGKHMTFVSIISEGFDHTAIDAICLCRPTRSPVMYIQTCGRAMRIHDGKESALILDYGRVVEACGPLDSPRVPKKGERNIKETQMKFCPKCYEYMPKTQMQCEVCGHTFATKPVEQDRTKNLTTKHSTGQILSTEEVRTSWIELDHVRIEKHLAKSGRTCTKIKFKPKNVFSEYITIYYPWGDSWLNKKSSEDIYTVLGISAKNHEEVESQTPILPKSIKIKWGAFPEIIACI